MKCACRATYTVLAATALSPIVEAQESVDPAHHYCWSENAGWFNWIPSGDERVRLKPGFLSGWLWAENIGWISLGDGSPADGLAYSNADGPDCGVNILEGGDLSGLAYGENIGWVNFDTRSTLTEFGKQARLDLPSQRFLGWAWSVNIGWVNLDDAENFVGVVTVCISDCDRSGSLDLFDFLCYQNQFVAGDLAADCDGNGELDLADFLCFISQFGEGCP